MDFSDDEDQLSEKLNKQSLNGDIRSRSDNAKGYLSNKIASCDPSLVQNLKVKNCQLLLILPIFSFFFFLGGYVHAFECQWRYIF